MSKVELKGIELSYKDVPGAGLQIYASFKDEHNFVECRTKAGAVLPVIETNAIMGYAPWTQFSPEEYSKLMNAIFKEIVELWNKKHNAPPG